jgi:glycosyltransferase involved in cell wall biosynthesis
MKNKPLPKITIVTPSYNQGAWLERTLCSVLDQGYPNLEYIVIDGGSTDGSKKILERYADRLSYWISEPDRGMYDAIQKGFSRATGELMGWINSDDMHHQRSLFTLAKLFGDLPMVEWMTGCRSVWDEEDRCVATEPARAWSEQHFLLGDHKWIQQESTFWRRSLWQRTGSTLNTNLKYAGDYELWLRFFDQAQLYSTDALLAGFRVRRSGQASLENMAAYEVEVELCLNEAKSQANNKLATSKKIEMRKRLIERLKFVGKSRLYQKLVEPLYQLPPRIYFDRVEQCFKLLT